MSVPTGGNAEALAWRRDTATLGRWVFLATEIMFFGALFLGYARIRLHDPDGLAVASRLTHAILGTLNTAVLLTSSFAMALAVRSAWLGEARHTRRLLWVTAAMGAAFLGIKGAEYTLEWRDGLVPQLHFTYAGEAVGAVATFFYFYFVATGLHALHVAIGVAALAWAAWRRDGAEGVEMLGLYWHFVDAVWILLYPLIYLVQLWR
jgi:cytochrome c oxidase subunit 3